MTQELKHAVFEKGERLLAEKFRARKHHPTPNNELEPLEAKPYLTLPFAKEDKNSLSYEILHGWFYSLNIIKIFGAFIGHSGVDYLLPYGHPVRAPFDGYAMSSYDSYPYLDKNGRIKKYKGINLRMGVGYFVQLYHPEENRFLQLGHLSDIEHAIPFSAPLKKGHRWTAANHTQTPEKIMAPNNPHVVSVKKGDLLGYVGYSGLTHEEDYQEGMDRPQVIDPSKIGSWSAQHIHMDEFSRNFATGQKSWRRDPYDIYMRARYYPTQSNNQSLGKEPLFVTNTQNRPHFVDTQSS